MAFTGTSYVTVSVLLSNVTFSSPESKTVTFSSGSHARSCLQREELLRHGEVAS